MFGVEVEVVEPGDGVVGEVDGVGDGVVVRQGYLEEALNRHGVVDGKCLLIVLELVEVVLVFIQDCVCAWDGLDFGLCGGGEDGLLSLFEWEVIDDDLWAFG